MKFELKFGTDGWRGEIARDFTFENVSLAAHAAATVMHEKMKGKTKMIVGYDRRFLSPEFAQTVATVYAEYGFEVLLADSYGPTPSISYAVKHTPGAAGATMITASHNPPDWNGFKFKEIFGGSARPELTHEFEKKAKEIQTRHYAVPSKEHFNHALKSGKIKYFDPLPTYFSAIEKIVDLDAIRKAKLKIGLDTMYGAASKHYVQFLKAQGLHVVEIHGEANPGFNGTAPEPIGKNLTELCTLVKNEKFSCGLATDGDADRLGAVDENGDYFTTQQILSVVYWHMIKNKNKRWNIARSVSTTKMVDLIAEKEGLKSYETPVGFKFIADKMVAGEAQIGGEESGGIGIIDHLPERDGPLTGLLLLELMAKTGKGLSAIYQEICKTIRPYYFIRHDLHLSVTQAEKAIGTLKNSPPQTWDGRALDRLSLLDGYKFYFKDGTWLLIRKSGTEPIFRIYAETESLQASQSLVNAAKAFVEA